MLSTVNSKNEVPSYYVIKMYRLFWVVSRKLIGVRVHATYSAPSPQELYASKRLAIAAFLAR